MSTHLFPRRWVPPLQGGTLFRRSNPQGVALGYHLAPRWGKRQETRDSPHAIRSSIRRTVTGFFPTVAWPSEAVRVDDESIALIHKQVEAPFYGPTRRCWSDQSPDAASWRAWLNRPTAGAGWLTGCGSARGFCCRKRTGNHGRKAKQCRDSLPCVPSVPWLKKE